ncbi:MULTISPECIES: M56/M15 family metallopeptidase [Niastella]|uniref:N-acetylmuramoyl-L-alanine amidase n=1 Tax=Niastella soli TaxID=2821487 RepID=A0ABS3Z0H9_9BACT|nr:M56/M15 family metallopeptidase [Niastella soli]MBO9203657.1 N-acetylmuramoyl-L-alanine amidase [Niastella soli]
MTFLLYLGKVMLCSGILLGYYWLFLRNKRFHHYNRFYLQGTLLLSVLLPLIRIPVLNQPQSPVNQAVYQTLAVLTVKDGEEELMGEGPGWAARLFTLENGLYLLYVIGVLVLLFAFIRSLLYIRRISKQYSFERIGGLKFFTTGEPGTPFSFLRSIFWNNELVFNSRDGQQIFRHELFHVQQKHSTDIIFTELITAFFWFNPFFYILKKELKAIHEFLADQYAISGNDRYAYAELLVLQTLKANNLPITNQFFQNHIKRRIAMITNNQSARYSYRSRLMALPVLALVFCAIAFRAQRSAEEDGKPVIAQKPITIIVDAGHGGIDPGAASLDGKVKEKDLALQICQKIQQLASAYNVNVVMTRSDENLPGGTTVIHDGLKARTALAQKINPDLFISIHVSSTGEQTVTSQTGFELFVSNKDDERAKQSKQLGSVVLQELSKVYAINETIKQRKQNVWVLEQTPCPAVLIECGFINNEKDLAYFSNSGNQETVAKKILEGIVNYKNKPVAMVNPSVIDHTPDRNERVEKTVKPAITTTAPVSSNSNSLPVAAPPPQQLFNDSTLNKLIKHFNRNTWYPKQALAQNAEGVVYFSVMVNRNGELNNFKTYEQAPAEANSQVTKLVIVSYARETGNAATEQLSNEELTKEYQSVMKKAAERKPDLSGCTPQLSPYYFQVSFRLEKKSATANKPVEAVVPASAGISDRQMLLPNGFLWKKQGKC